MMNQLIALLDGREVGTVSYKNARLNFVYEDKWRFDPNAYPLSLSMPLASAEHGHARIEPFLWGLMPDNDRVLENWDGAFKFLLGTSLGSSLMWERTARELCSLFDPSALRRCERGRLREKSNG